MRQENYHRLFEVGVTLKGLHALLELVTAVAILTLSPVTVAQWFTNLAERADEQGWPGFIIDSLLRLAQIGVHGGQHFAGIYLLVVGMINLLLVIGLLTGALWSYPTALTALAMLMAYQLYRYTHTHAPILIYLTIFDFVVWWLVRHEYLVLRSMGMGRRGWRYREAGGNS